MNIFNICAFQMNESLLQSNDPSSVMQPNQMELMQWMNAGGAATTGCGGGGVGGSCNACHSAGGSTQTPNSDAMLSNISLSPTLRYQVFIYLGFVIVLCIICLCLLYSIDEQCSRHFNGYFQDLSLETGVDVESIIIILILIEI